MTRIVVIDAQPAVRAGLAMLLRTEPGLVPVGAATSGADGVELVARRRPDVVLLDHALADGDGLALCRRLRAQAHVILYTADTDPALPVVARVAGADGVVDKTAPPEELFEAIRVVARGGTALPPVRRAELDVAAHRVDPDDLALLAMLVDRTSPAEAAETLHLDRRRINRQTERLLGRLRARPRAAAA